MSTYTGPRRHADDPERRKWQNPEALLADIGLKPGMVIADIGCGGGFFALPAARILGEKGQVYGVDIDAGSVSELESLAAKEGLTNIKLTVGKAEQAVLCNSCADVVFFGIDLHDFEDPNQVLRNARKMLRPGGELVDLDWKKEPMPLGPPLQKRFSENDAARLISAAGFKVVNTKDVGPYHYLITARK
ncbi:MAG: methyltransferase domain-containing protein [Chloroflexi bacterium]|nr:methyltransferase domain-containing protein [Chloroflexota bacterium]